MRKLYAFFRRDFLLTVSYRFQLVLDLVRMAGYVVVLFFIGQMFSGGFSEYLARYGNNYFAFALIGMAVSSFVSTGLQTLSSEIRNAQVQGTLESLLLTATPPTTILVGSTLWTFIESFVYCLVYLGAAVVVLQLDLDLTRIGLVLGVLALTFGCFLSLGMISAAFIMIFKQGNPINMIFGTSSYFLGGLLFPVEILPGPLVTISYLLPMTQAAQAVREVMLVSPETSRWIPAVVYLGIFTLVAFPLGVFSLRYSLARAKKDGSLVQF